MIAYVVHVKLFCVSIVVVSRQKEKKRRTRTPAQAPRSANLCHCADLCHCASLHPSRGGPQPPRRSPEQWERARVYVQIISERQRFGSREKMHHGLCNPRTARAPEMVLAKTPKTTRPSRCSGLEQRTRSSSEASTCFHPLNTLHTRLEAPQKHSVQATKSKATTTKLNNCSAQRGSTWSVEIG